MLDLLTERPGPPEDKPVITGVNKFAIKMTWKEPEDNGGAPITGYIVEKCDVQTGAWRRAATSKTPFSAVDCLEEFKEYKFRVLAENMIGISEPGPESDVILTREQVPDVDYDSMCKFHRGQWKILYKKIDIFLSLYFEYILNLFQNIVKHLLAIRKTFYIQLLFSFVLY